MDRDCGFARLGDVVVANENVTAEAEIRKASDRCPPSLNDRSIADHDIKSSHPGDGFDVGQADVNGVARDVLKVVAGDPSTSTLFSNQDQQQNLQISFRKK